METLTGFPPPAAPSSGWRSRPVLDAIIPQRRRSMSDNKVSTLLAVGVALTLAVGCSAGVKPTNPTGAAGSSGPDAGVDRPSVVGSAGTTGAGGAPGNAGSNGTGGTGQTCTPTITCDPPGGRYCNTIGNGCPGQKLECGACPGDSTCS